jgi:hypothetical protein
MTREEIERLAADVQDCVSSCMHDLYELTACMDDDELVALMYEHAWREDWARWDEEVDEYMEFRA